MMFRNDLRVLRTYGNMRSGKTVALMATVLGLRALLGRNPAKPIAAVFHSKPSADLFRDELDERLNIGRKELERTVMCRYMPRQGAKAYEALKAELALRKVTAVLIDDAVLDTLAPCTLVSSVNYLIPENAYVYLYQTDPVVGHEQITQLNSKERGR